MKKVLLVDDANSIRQVFTQVIKQCGYEAVSASNAQEALSILDSQLKPDLLITDINMPGMNGIDLAREVRERFKGLPVLVMSTESDKRLIMQGKDAGVTGWLLKPVQHENFVRQLQKFLGEGQLT